MYSLITTLAELLAYPRPSDIKQYRREAALVVKAWKEWDQRLLDKEPSEGDPYQSTTAPSGAHVQDGQMYALTIEANGGNILVRAVQPHLLLIMVGCKPVHQLNQSVRFTPELKGDARYPEPKEIPKYLNFSTPKLKQKVNSGTTSHTDSPIERTEDDHLRSSRHSKELARDGEGSRGSSTPAEESNGESSQVQAEHELILVIQRHKLDEMVDYLEHQLVQAEFVVREDAF